MLLIAPSVLAFVLLLTVAVVPGEAQQKTKMRMALGALGVSNLVVQAAECWNFFSKNGLEVEPILMKSGTSLITLLRGEVDFVSGVGPASVNGTLGGIPTRAIWISQNRLSYKLVTKHRFASLQDLKSKRIGVMGIGALNHVSLILAMEKAGFNPRDFTFMSTPPALILSALETGTIDAASLNPPFLMQALAKGYHVLLDVEALVEMPSGGLTTLVKTMEERPNDVGK